MKPRVPILSKAFSYTNAANTNVAKTFAKVRREQREAQKERDRKITRILKVV